MEAQDPWAREVYHEILDDPSASTKFVDSLKGVERTSGRHGFDRQEVDQVLDHVMRREHALVEFETGRVVFRRFDPSGEMADAFLRLRDGKARANDVVLLEHELVESNYMRSTGADYAEAHAFANRQFSWEP